MSTCKVPNCYQTKKNECIKPNAWITFLTTIKNNKVTTMYQKKKLYKEWIKKYQNNDLLDKNAYYGSLCLKSKEETRKSKPSKFSKQYTISDKKKNTNIVTISSNNSIHLLKLYAALIPNWKDDDDTQQQQQQNNYIFHKYLFKPITPTNYLNCDIHSLIARGLNGWIYLIQEKLNKRMNRFYIGKVQLVGDDKKEIQKILIEKNIPNLEPITNLSYQKEVANQNKLYQIIQFKPNEYHFEIPHILNHVLLKTNYETIQLGMIGMDYYSPAQYDQTSWKKKLSHYYNNPTHENYTKLQKFMTLVMTFFVELHTKCSFSHGDLHLSNIFFSRDPEKKHIIIDFARSCDLLKETDKSFVIDSILYDYYFFVQQFHTANQEFQEKEQYIKVNSLLQKVLGDVINMTNYYYKDYFTPNQLDSLHSLYNWNLKNIQETIEQHQQNYQQLFGILSQKWKE